VIKKFLVGIIFFSISFVLKSQQIGLANSNFATTNAVLLNPSKSADPKVNFDMTLFGMSSFAKNDYIFTPRTSIDFSNLGNVPILEDFEEQKKYGLYYELDIMLPSFSKAINEYGFGTFIRTRLMVNAHNMPSHLSKFFLYGFGYNEQHDEEYQAGDFMLKSMSWSEIGINFSRLTYQYNFSQVSAGINLKRLIGIHNAGFYFADSDYEVVADTINIYLLNGNFGYALPGDKLPGKGWGLDIGFTYKRTLKPVNRYIPFNKFSSCEQRPYDYKIGVSFLDIGGIKFNQNSTLATFDNASTLWKDFRQTNLGDLKAFEEELQGRFGDKISNTNEFRASLPTAIVIEIDKRFRSFFYLNTTGLYNVRRRENLGVSRLGFFSLTPRFEFDRFEAAFPITLYNYKSPAFGVMLKGGGFYFGTNNLIPLLFNVNVFGADIFLGYKYSIRSNKSCQPVVDERKNWWCPSCGNDKKKKRK